ncbi:MAG: hypothetical protein ACREAY_01835 [Nitrososphaera sp.]|uniref:hypothetical protein n=1 Tax=Nitrososphaera sp. TaxID=1971748 RepID=UPI003D700344
MENLIQKKEEIVRQHAAKMGEINARVLQLLNDGIGDKKTGAGVKLDLVNLFKAQATFDRHSSTGMDSSDRLELSKGFFENAKMMIETLRADPGYQSLLEDIDAQLELYRKEVEAIDQELRTVEGKKGRKELRQDRERAVTRSS